MQRNGMTPRRVMWLLVFLGFGLWLTLGVVASAPAQDEKAAPAKEAEPAPPAPAPAPAPAEAAPAPAAPPAAGGGEEAPAAKESFLVYVFKASPTFFFIMGILSVYLVTSVISNFMKLRLPQVIPPQMVGSLDAMLGDRKFKEAYEIIRNDQSLFARSLTAGVERLSHGFDRGLEAMTTIAEDGKMEMEHRVSPVATIGTVAPMIGLMGTVLGMILAFQVIAQGGQPKPAILAENIGLALVTTLEGIVVAVPAIFCFAFFRNKISRIVFEVESVAETYLWRFAAALKK